MRSLAKCGRTQVFATSPALRLAGPLREEAEAAGVAHANQLLARPATITDEMKARMAEIASR